MPNTNLADLVERGDKAGDGSPYFVLKIPKTTKPVKEFGLRELKPNANGVPRYDVPKSDIYCYYATDLGDGSVLTCMRRKPIPFEKRVELYEAGIAAGLDVVVPEEGKTKAKPVALTLEGLANFKPKAGDKRKATVTNAL